MGVWQLPGLGGVWAVGKDSTPPPQLPPTLQALINGEKVPPTIEFNDKNSAKIFGAGIEKQVGGRGWSVLWGE